MTTKQRLELDLHVKAEQLRLARGWFRAYARRHGAPLDTENAVEIDSALDGAQKLIERVIEQRHERRKGA